MQTSNTLHIQRCSVSGCLSDAIITEAYGQYAIAPRGFCQQHLDERNSKLKEQEFENQILRDLGFAA